MADEETVDLGQAQFDLVLSGLSLHWVNDLPGVFAKVRAGVGQGGGSGWLG